MAMLLPRYWGRALIALVSVVILLLTGYAWHSVTTLESRVTKLGGLGLGSGKDGAVDILLVGTDSRTDANGNPLSASELAKMHAGDDVSTNTDTIVLVRIPTDGSSATAISIPRDTYVDVPGLGKSKINGAFGATKELKREALVNAGDDPADAEKQGVQAGRKALVDTVEQLTGAQIDHYAEIGLVGFVLLTDAVGGVDVCLKAPVNEPYSGAHFPAGEQTLDGDEALSFVRQRHGLPRGDLDRIVRQQVFMASLAHKVLSAGTLSNPSKLSNLEKAVSRSIVIDDDWDVVRFVEQLKDLTGGKIRFATIPVITDQGWSDDGQQSVVKVDPDQVRAFTSSLLTPSRKKNGRTNSDYTVNVVNAGSVEGLASNVSNIVTLKGFGKGTAGNADSSGASSSQSPDEDSQSAVYAHDSGDAAARALAKDLGGLPVRADSSLPETTLRVMLTDSYTGPGSLADDSGDSQAAAAAASASAPSSDGSASAAPTPAPPQFTAGGSGPQCVN
ncbi:LCP family protein [Gordonia jinhuaensis]